MELRVLKYFLAVARAENISAAAENLHVTQPTLSRQLMDLEDELGKTLFVRAHKKISLTEDGLLLKKRAEEIVELVSRTESELKNDDKEISGDVYIGSGETEGIRFIAKAAKQIRDSGYDIRFHIYSGHDASVAQRIDRGLLDFGVFLEGTHLEKYDSIKLPYSDTWGVLMRKDSHLAEKDHIEPEDLWELPLIISLQADSNNEFSGWLMRSRDQLNIVATYNLLFNASIMVEEGLGYALCIDRIVRTDGDSVLCFKPLRPARSASSDIVWKKHKPLSKPAEVFLKYLKDNIR